MPIQRLRIHSHIDPSDSNKHPHWQATLTRPKPTREPRGRPQQLGGVGLREDHPLALEQARAGVRAGPQLLLLLKLWIRCRGGRPGGGRTGGLLGRPGTSRRVGEGLGQQEAAGLVLEVLGDQIVDEAAELRMEGLRDLVWGVAKGKEGSPPVGSRNENGSRESNEKMGMPP